MKAVLAVVPLTFVRLLKKLPEYAMLATVNGICIYSAAIPPMKPGITPDGGAGVRPVIPACR